MKPGRVADASEMKKLTGSVTYRERMALPADATVHVRLEDVSHQDAAPTLVTEISFAPQQSVPIPFELEYDPDSLDERSTYALRAEIRRGDDPLFVSAEAAPVLTRGGGDHVDFVLVRSAAGTDR